MGTMIQISAEYHCCDLVWQKEEARFSDMTDRSASIQYNVQDRLAPANLNEAHDTVSRQTRPTLQTKLADQLPQQNQSGRDWSPRR